MRKINLNIQNQFQITVSSQTIKPEDEIQTPFGPGIEFGKIDFGRDGAEINTARENAAQVIWATIEIEQVINEIIYKYLFDKPDVKCQFFRDEIINSNSLTFAFKKNLLNKIINQTDVIKGKDKSILEKNLKNIMEYRNSFAHGSILFEVKKGVMLNYFKDRVQKHVLDDNYWEVLESEFNSGERLLNLINNTVQKVV